MSFVIRVYAQRVLGTVMGENFPNYNITIPYAETPHSTIFGYFGPFGRVKGRSEFGE